ncbi:tetratricopeptide repeat protein [Flavobacterium selenitireducens]|uniref:tetratricopeptide repeat protein n=1 Tax=Flavobacterium selenitireducens TaxID=2722704 RepID=UPI00168A6215|nr:tetratricopeptide repeat protein [Flavobacterium selenitireducens]MBD3583319.1 hypothetical protein [Flavobacterium selenitireducens]
MNLSDFTYLLNHPEAINGKRTDELDKIVAEFPYFQSARALRLKGLYNEDSFRYNYALKVTAAFTSDRSVLFDFITSDNFTSVDRAAYVEKQEQLRAIEVSDIQEVTQKPEIEELTMDDSFRASLDTEFVRAEELEADRQIPENEKEQSNVLRELEAEGNELAPAETDRSEIEIPESEVGEFEIEESEIEEAEIEEAEAREAEFDAGESEISEKSQVEPEYDAATRSVLDSIKEAEQYAKSLVVADVEEVKTQQVPDVAVATEDVVEIEEVAASKENLEIGKPLDFSSSEKHSFHEWLQLSKFQPIERKETGPDTQEVIDSQTQSDASEDDSERQKKKELIDKFIESNPKIPKITPEAKSPSFIFEPSQADNSYLMTETLARVYLEQKKYEKAIQAYEILILKYPEKNSFFADRILDIRNLQQNNKL